jgi:hypothetical protein
MVLDPHERIAVEQRTVAIGELIDEIDAKLDTPTFDVDSLRERTALFRERADLNIMLMDDCSTRRAAVAGINCKICHAKIGSMVAAESMKNIKTLLEAVGVATEFVDSRADRQGPLCRKCMLNWGAGEDDLNPLLRR